MNIGRKEGQGESDKLPCQYGVKYFKTTTKTDEERHEITWGNFVECTKEKPPYAQLDEKQKRSFYALCPGCRNPIQLIGMLRNGPHNPYGKHAGKSIVNLAEWSQSRYETCLLRAKGTIQQPTDDEEAGFYIVDDYVLDLYDLLRGQFDRVVYIISRALGIRAYGGVWVQAIDGYLGFRAYCYRWLTDSNLPYVFAHFGLQQQSLWGIKIKYGSPLYNGLEKHPNIIFSAPDKNGYCSWQPKSGHLHLKMRFYNHRHKRVRSDTLVEYLQFCIDDWSDGGTTIYEATLSYDELEFQQIRFHGNEKYRQQWLLDIAKENLPDLERTE